MTDSKIGSWITGGNPTEGRKKDDFYPTPPDCARSLLRHIEAPYHIWEPACGTGEMAKEMEGEGHEVISSDKVDRGYGFQCDFLEAVLPLTDCVVTNPPFKLAEAFIRKCKDLEIRLFAFLLKTQYFHAYTRLPLFRDIRPSKILALTWRPDFSGGRNPTMDCVWAVWDGSSTTTEYMPIERYIK